MEGTKWRKKTGYNTGLKMKKDYTSLKTEKKTGYTQVLKWRERDYTQVLKWRK